MILNNSQVIEEFNRRNYLVTLVDCDFSGNVGRAILVMHKRITKTMLIKTLIKNDHWINTIKL